MNKPSKPATNNTSIRLLPINPASAYTSFVDVLRERSMQRGAERAYVFLADGDDQEVNLSYVDLDRRARAIGAELQARCAPGDRALLVYEPGLEYVAAYFGCLYAGVIAVPAYPPDPLRLEKTLPRLQVICDDSEATVVLTSSMVIPLKDFFIAMNPGTSAKAWLNTEEIEISKGDLWRPPTLTGDTIAFLQYTSGSTSTPRGVMVTHRNLLENVATSCVTGGYTSEMAFVSWLPQYHDMGLIGGILQPLYGGFLGVLMSPMAFLQRPYRWLRAISKYNGRTSAFPNFALDLCVRKVTPEQRATLDLSCWKIAVNGAEPIRTESIERFAEYFGPCGFRAESHCAGYGLAEATLIVTFNTPQEPPQFVTVDEAELARHTVVAAGKGSPGAKTLAGCGKTLGDMRVVIVDPETGIPCPPDAVGEIWVSGSSLARGYWNRPEETAGTFRATLAGRGDRSFLRTGDLGFLLGGELYVTGRLKDMIIIDGMNHYPQDIEATVEFSHPAVRAGCCAAFPVDGHGGENVVVVAETTGDVTPDVSREIVAAIRREVSARHDIRLYEIKFLKSRSIPKTSSGKLQRHACRAGYLSGSLDLVEV